MSNIVVIDQELYDYINDELFQNIYVLHPYHAVSGKLSSQERDAIRSYGTQVVVSLDSNILGKILKCVKKGSFRGVPGVDAKRVTGLLCWSAINGYGLSAYVAINEAAVKTGNNVEGNKLLDLFNTLFDKVPFDDVVRAFHGETVTFSPKSFDAADGSDAFDFAQPYWDFEYLYAAVLHLAYVLRTLNKQEERIRSFFQWYFSECPVSVYGFSYALLCLVLTSRQSYTNRPSLGKTFISAGEGECFSVTVTLNGLAVIIAVIGIPIVLAI